MNFSNEMIEKAKSASSVEELMKLAAGEGVALTEEEAKQYFDFMHSSRLLTDEELENVAGGKGDRKPKYKAGQRVMFTDPRIPDPSKQVRYGSIMSSWFSSVVKVYFYYVQFDDGEVMDFALENPYCPVKVL